MQEEPAIEIEDPEGMDTEREGYNWNCVLSWKAEQERVLSFMRQDEKELILCKKLGGH